MHLGGKMPKLVRETKNQSASDLEYVNEIEKLWQDSEDSTVEKLEAFTKFISRQSLTKFLARSSIFQKQLEVNGSIVEVGVHRGASFMAWAHLSSIFEPVNYLREIIGFDTFEGFKNINPKDATGRSEHLKVGGFNVGASAESELVSAINLYDKNRLMGHIEKCKLVKGDACFEIPKYLEKNPHTLVSMLHLDADLYEPTAVALEHFLPRMPKGAIILFDELNMDLFPGETIALLEKFNINDTQIKRFSYATSMSYLII